MTVTLVGGGYTASSYDYGAYVAFDNYMTIQVGDLLVMTILENATQYTNTPSGWTLYGNYPDAAGVTWRVWWKIAANTQENHQWTGGQTNRFYGFYAFRGHDTSAPFDAVSIFPYAGAVSSAQVPQWNSSRNGSRAAAMSYNNGSDVYDVVPSGWTQHGTSGLTQTIAHVAVPKGTTNFGPWTYTNGSGYPNTNGFKTVLAVSIKPPNSAPTAPTSVTSPTAGVVVDTIGTVSHSGNASDPDGDTLTFYWELSTNGGSTYTPKYSGVGGAGASFSYNYVNDMDTSNARWRVRAYDGELYSAWIESSNFTISHGSYTPAMIL